MFRAKVMKAAAQRVFGAVTSVGIDFSDDDDLDYMVCRIALACGEHVAVYATDSESFDFGYFETDGKVCGDVTRADLDRLFEVACALDLDEALTFSSPDEDEWHHALTIGARDEAACAHSDTYRLPLCDAWEAISGEEVVA